MQLSKVHYRRVFRLGDFQSEEILIEYTFEEGEKCSAEEALLRARQEAVRSSTPYLAKQRNKGDYNE